MSRIHAFLMPLLILSLIGSGSAFAWTYSCCPEKLGQKMPDSMEFSIETMDQSMPAEARGSDMELSAPMVMSDCGGDGDATGMCCLAGVMGPPSIAFALSAVQGIPAHAVLPGQIQQLPSGLFRPPKA